MALPSWPGGQRSNIINDLAELMFFGYNAIMLSKTFESKGWLPDCGRQQIMWVLDLVEHATSLIKGQVARV
eukprot:scaffold18230_cov18-Tisochrysis_lutea.AAC.1